MSGDSVKKSNKSKKPITNIYVLFLPLSVSLVVVFRLRACPVMSFVWGPVGCWSHIMTSESLKSV